MDSTGLNTSSSDNQKKKMMALIALGVIGFMIIVIILASLLSEGSSQSQPPQASNHKEIVQVTPVVPSNQWQTFSNSQFEIQYPPSWKVSDYSSQNGTGVMFLPSTLPDGVLSPKLEIEVVPTSSLSLDKRIAGFRSGGFTEIPYRSGDIVGYEFSHSVPYKPVNGQIMNTPIEEHFIVFENNDLLYSIGYEYDQQGGAQVKKVQEEMVKTFQLK